MQSETVTKINEAILAAQAEMKPVKKDRNNPFYNSKYADLPAVWESIAPFRKHGLTIVQMPVNSEPHTVSIETRMTHTSGEWYASILTLPLAKSDPQGVGSALTYGRRYALGCMTGQVTEDDDDGNSASITPPGRTVGVAQVKKVTDSKLAAAKKISELRAEGVVTQAGKVNLTPGVQSVIQDPDWELFLDYMSDDPDRANVGKQLKTLLAIGKVADLTGSARVSFIQEFQKSCKETGVACEEWVKS